jgi:hypothetical protein
MTLISFRLYKHQFVLHWQPPICFLYSLHYLVQNHLQEPAALLILNLLQLVRLIKNYGTPALLVLLLVS